jgi:hypothetical protein
LNDQIDNFVQGNQNHYSLKSPFQETLQEVADFRKHHKNMFSCESMFASDLIEYLPWTASSHGEGLRVALSDLVIN